MSGQLDLRDKSAERCDGGKEAGQRVARGVVTEDVRLPGMTVRTAIKAGRAADWSELMKSVEINPWMMVHYQAKQDDDECKSRLCRRARISGDGSSRQLDREETHCRTCALIATGIRLKITSGGSRRGMVRAAKAIGGVRRAAASTNWTDPNRVVVIQDIAGPSAAKVSRGACENLMCLLELICRRAETASRTRSSKVCTSRAG